MQKSDRSAMLGTMEMSRLVPKISVPIMASMLIQALYNIVDSIFVSRFDPNGLTAVSLAMPFQMLMIALSTGLFYLGVLVGYFIVLPVCLQFFMNYTVSDAVANTITIGSYMSMFFSMVLLIGVVFEFPTVVLALNRLGVLDRSALRKGRRYAVVIVLVLAALITPSDPFSMFVLAIPLYFLYEFSILLCSKSAESPETNE